MSVDISTVANVCGGGGGGGRRKKEDRSSTQDQINIKDIMKSSTSSVGAGSISLNP